MADMHKQISMFERLLLVSPGSTKESPGSTKESPGSTKESPVKHDEPPEEDWTDFKFIHWPLSAPAVEYTVSGDGTSSSSDESKNWTQINAAEVDHPTCHSISTCGSAFVVPKSDLPCYSASLSDQSSLMFSHDAQPLCFNSYDRTQLWHQPEFLEYLPIGNQSAQIPEVEEPVPQLVELYELQPATFLQAHLPEDQPVSLLQSHQPHLYVEFPTSSSIPSTYCSEMIKSVIGERSKAGKMKNLKAYKRPAPYKIFSQSSRVSCQACGIVVSSRGHLKRHQTSHGANLQFSCTICDCSFTRIPNLMKHHLRAHGVKSDK